MIPRNHQRVGGLPPMHPRPPVGRPTQQLPVPAPLQLPAVRTLPKLLTLHRDRQAAAATAHAKKQQATIIYEQPAAGPVSLGSSSVAAAGLSPPHLEVVAGRIAAAAANSTAAAHAHAASNHQLIQTTQLQLAYELHARSVAASVAGAERQLAELTRAHEESQTEARALASSSSGRLREAQARVVLLQQQMAGLERDAEVRHRLQTQEQRDLEQRMLQLQERVGQLELQQHQQAQATRQVLTTAIERLSPPIDLGPRDSRASHTVSADQGHSAPRTATPEVTVSEQPRGNSREEKTMEPQPAVSDEQRPSKRARSESKDEVPHLSPGPVSPANTRKKVPAAQVPPPTPAATPFAIPQRPLSTSISAYPSGTQLRLNPRYIPPVQVPMRQLNADRRLFDAAATTNGAPPRPRIQPVQPPLVPPLPPRVAPSPQPKWSSPFAMQPPDIPVPEADELSPEPAPSQSQENQNRAGAAQMPSGSFDKEIAEIESAYQQGPVAKKSSAQKRKAATPKPKPPSKPKAKAKSKAKPRKKRRRISWTQMEESESEESDHTESDDSSEGDEDEWRRGGKRRKAANSPEPEIKEEPTFEQDPDAAGGERKQDAMHHSDANFDDFSFLTQRPAEAAPKAKSKSKRKQRPSAADELLAESISFTQPMETIDLSPTRDDGSIVLNKHGGWLLLRGRNRRKVNYAEMDQEGRQRPSASSSRPFSFSQR